MQMPTIIKQTGRVEGGHAVYIEDYVYTYLRELKTEGSVWPCRAALFGKTAQNEGRSCYFVYGAADILEEMEAGKSQEQVREEFFGEFDLIGYVNVYGDGRELPGRKEGYYIFYEANEPMQAYLLARYERKCRQQRIQEAEEDRPGDSDSGKRGFEPLEILKRLFYGISMIVLSIAANTIGDYDKMHRFTEVAKKAVEVMQTKG